MIALQQAITDARAGRYIEAWAEANAAGAPRERAQLCTYVRYHAGDLEGALAEARAGLREAPDDVFLASTATEIALSLHRGEAAEQLLERWRANAAPAEAERLAAAQRELAALREAESGAARGVRRARWISALACALALAFLLRGAGRAA